MDNQLRNQTMISNIVEDKLSTSVNMEDSVIIEVAQTPYNTQSSIDIQKEDITLPNEDKQDSNQQIQVKRYPLYKSKG